MQKNHIVNIAAKGIAAKLTVLFKDTTIIKIIGVIISKYIVFFTVLPSPVCLIYNNTAIS